MNSRASRRANLASAGVRTLAQALETPVEYREAQSDMTLVTSLQTCKTRLEEELRELDDTLLKTIENDEREELEFVVRPFARKTMLQLPAKI